MNSREQQTINIANMILAFTLVTVFVKLLSWGWRKSKVGTILVLTVGPYLYLGSTIALNNLQTNLVCSIKPHQPGCIALKKENALKDLLMKRAIAEQQHQG